MIKAVAFDLDDTLYPLKDFVKSGYRAVGLFLEKQYGINSRDFAKKCFSLWLIHGSRGRIFDFAVSSFNLDSDMIPHLVSIYRQHIPDIQLYPDAFGLIGYLKDKYKLGIITDGISVTQWNKIKKLGLDSLVDAIIVTCDYGPDWEKPSLKPFHKLTEIMGIEGKNIVYIGDNPRKDFIGARALGIKCIRLLRGEHKKLRLTPEFEADALVEDLLEVPPVLKKWEKGDF